MVKIVADNKIPFLKGVFEDFADITYLPGRDISRDKISDADALIVRTRTLCNEKLLSGTAVKYIATATIGYDHLDTGYLEASGIRWSNAPGCNSGSVMQYIASALVYIATARRMKFSDITFGIVGVGHVGKKVEHLASTLGMKVLLNDPPRQRSEGGDLFTELDHLLKESDIVTMHVPLNREGPDTTYHISDFSFFTKMKKGAWFINSSRGEVACTLSLVKALNKQLVGGSVLDVWENEPDPDKTLFNMADLATPHIAGYSLDGKANGTAQSVRSISRFFKLGMDDWYPSDIPGPSNALIDIRRINHKGEELVKYVLNSCYEVVADSVRLKKDPGNFEGLRDNYPPRREYGAYTLNTGEELTDEVKLLLNLGFEKC